MSLLVNEGALPVLTELAGSAGRLDSEVRVLCENPSAETWARARAAWKEAYLAWRRATPFLFGPGDKLERSIGRGTVNGVVLDAAVEAKDLHDLLQQPDQRGYAAVEYLLFAPASVAAATTAGRRAHLRDATGEIARLTAQAKQEWADNYGKAFAAAGDGRPFLVPADALSLVFSRLLNVTERTLRDRIGMPSGFFGAEVTKPEALDAWRSRTTKAGFLATMDGVRLALTVGGDASLVRLIATKDGLVEAKNPALAGRLGEQLDRLQKTIAAMGGDDLRLELELKKDPSLMKPLYRQFQELQNELVQASLVLELDVYGGVKANVAQ